MNITITTINGQEIKVGEIKNKTASFFINSKRHFTEADAIGIDEGLKDKLKSAEWIRFNLWTGEQYTLPRKQFLSEAWIYPPKDSPEYKANSSVFKPKLVMTRQRLKEIKKERTQNWQCETCGENNSYINSTCFNCLIEK